MCLGRACDTAELQVHRPRPGKGLRREKRLSPRGAGTLRVDVAGSPRSTQTNGNQGPRSQRLGRERGSVPQRCASGVGGILGEVWRRSGRPSAGGWRGASGIRWVETRCVASTGRHPQLRLTWVKVPGVLRLRNPQVRASCRLLGWSELAGGSGSKRGG